jgi:hypothetical protein
MFHSFETLSIKEEDTMEHWVALDGGGFQRCAEEEAYATYLASVKPTGKIVKKRRTKPKLVVVRLTRSQTRPRVRSKTDRLCF